jgi:sugar/nucleoside kinase (ribokinase family)
VVAPVTLSGGSAGAPRHDYTTVGHVTIDVLCAGSIEEGDPARPGSSHPRCRRPGGTAFYSALQAARLGLRTRIVTQGNPGEIEALLAPYRDELDLTIVPAEHTTTLHTAGAGHERRQRLLAWAGPIAESVAAVDTTILHLAPVARETPHARVGSAQFVGLTPQGLVRKWDATGEIALAPLHRELLPERCDAWVLSERERKCCAQQLARAAAQGAVVAVTAGHDPTELQLPGGERPRIPVPPVEAPVDDLGAGDVFAAAFFVALREGQSPARAAAFASAAAAVRVAGVGPGAIGDRATIEEQLDAAS